MGECRSTYPCIDKRRFFVTDISVLPKVSLHDHLDGGLRPETIIELAASCGYDGLPTTDAQALREWFLESAGSGSLVRYLETFEHTIAVMQTKEGLSRVAREFVLDQVADGVVYAESRYAPEQHLSAGLTLDDVVEAVNDGFADGMAQAKESGHPIVVRSLLTGMRHAQRSLEIAELTVKHRDEAMAGYDIAGAEDGFAPTLHLPAFEHLRQNNMHFTIHAGEAFGLPSIWEAVQLCGAERIGHGVRLIDDLSVDGQAIDVNAKPVAQWTQAEFDAVAAGSLASYIRDRRIALEVCPSSNLQTAAGGATTIESHPITLFHRLGFRVTLNPDNRLVSGTTITREMQLLADEAGWGLDDFERVTVNAMRSAFLPYAQRKAILDEQIVPGYAAARNG
ncbi:adenosine deaminase [Ornithinimicrobium sp. Arc0846-15]|nr:adenosine deaminase [Ornithinimicrobium laminariae]